MLQDKMKHRLFKDDLTDTWFKLGIVFGILSIAAVVLFFIFGRYLVDGGINCAIYTIFHIYCPGCGGTRSFYHMIHGHFIKSILMNPFVPYTYADYLIFMVNTILVKTTKKLGFQGFPVTATILAGVGLLLVQWVIRNILLLAFHITCL